MLKVCFDHRTRVKVYRSPRGELFSVPQRHEARASILHCSLTAHVQTIIITNYQDITQCNSRCHIVVSVCVCVGREGSLWQTANKRWTKRGRNVARMTRLGSGPLYICILTLPIQKAHIYTHARQKDILKSSIQIQFFINKKTWTSRYQSALSHWCNVTVYIFKLVYTGRQYLCWKN